MNWIAGLQELRVQDRGTQSARVSLTRAEQEVLLQQVNAAALLQDINQHLLNGAGTVKEETNMQGYGLILTLSWSGPPSAARPDEGKDRRFIFIGLDGQTLYVNNKQVISSTKDSLQAALLEAARNKGKRIHQHKR